MINATHAENKTPATGKERTPRLILHLLVFLLFTLYALRFTAFAADGTASLQFSIAAPDPVIAGEELNFQILAVNSGNTTWLPGTYYWVAEIYTVEAENIKFMTKTSPITPSENVPPGGAHGVKIPFHLPENLNTQRLLYKAVLIKDGNIILNTGYKGFQVLEREFKPPKPKDFSAGGDITFSYKNSSSDGWDNHQGITAANIVGKLSKSSFLFNTYLLHTRNKPITLDIILLNLYMPIGVLSAGDISPTLGSLSMEGQGMRGVSFERNLESSAWTALAGQIVKPEDSSSINSGRFARYSFGVKYSYNLLENMKLTANSVLNKDDKYSTRISTDTSTIKPQQNLVYGGNLEWNLLENLLFTSDYELSSTDPDTDLSGAKNEGSAFREELKYKSSVLDLGLAFSRIDPEFASFASPSVIQDRKNYEAGADIYPAQWLSFSVALNKYEDNLDKDPAKTTTQQTQTSFSNALKIKSTLVNTSYMTNASLGEPSSVQDNQTATLNFSVTQPFGQHTVTAGYQTSDFTDNTGLSSDLSSKLMSFSGSFRLSPRLSFSAGFVNSGTDNKDDSSSSKSTTINVNSTYLLPTKSLAFQIWGTMNSTESDSALSPMDYGSMAVSVETLWLKSKSSKITFGLGMKSKTDKLNSANDYGEITILTRYGYTF